MTGYLKQIHQIKQTIADYQRNALSSFAINPPEQFDRKILVIVLKWEYSGYKIEYKSETRSIHFHVTASTSSIAKLPSLLNIPIINSNFKSIKEKEIPDGLYECMVNRICAFIQSAHLEKLTDTLLVQVDGYDCEFLELLLSKVELSPKPKYLKIVPVKLEMKNGEWGAFFKISTKAKGKQETGSFKKLTLGEFKLHNYAQKLDLAASPFYISTFIEEKYKEQGFSLKNLFNYLNSLEPDQLFCEVFNRPQAFDCINNRLNAVKAVLIEDSSLTGGKETFISLLNAFNYLTKAEDCKSLYKAISHYDNEFKEFIFAICGLGELNKIHGIYKSFLKNLLPTKGFQWKVLAEPHETSKYNQKNYKVPEQIARHVGDSCTTFQELKINGKTFSCTLPFSSRQTNYAPFFKEILKAFCDAGWNKAISEQEIELQVQKFVELALADIDSEKPDQIKILTEQITTLAESHSPLLQVLQFTSISALSTVVMWIKNILPEFNNQEFASIHQNKGICMDIKIQDAKNYTVKTSKGFGIWDLDTRIMGDGSISGRELANVTLVLQATITEGKLSMEKRIHSFAWATEDSKIINRIAELWVEKLIPLDPKNEIIDL